MKKLPIGIQTLKEIITGNYVYIDKTSYALEIIENYKYVFLSRPRRFGKSLFLDTLKEIFEGNKELFEGLYIYDKYDFKEYPVIKISWGGNFDETEKLRKRAMFILKNNQERLGVKCESDTPEEFFAELIQKSYEKYQKPVAVLIDEYDKPIFDNLQNKEVALKNRDFLRGFYVQIKESDEYMKFAFLTGITKFAKASIFSGLNNLVDISLREKYASICGYTQKDVESEFKEHLKEADLEKVKEWYNGYNFLGESVYNPFDILQFIDNDFVFKNYWWSSGQSLGIFKEVTSGRYYIPELENLKVNETAFDTVDVENFSLEALLFQGGYLTIDRVIYDEDFDMYEYKLKIPNKEIQKSLNELFLNFLTDGYKTDKHSIMEALRGADFEKMKDALYSLFASIPYNNYTNNNISVYEGYYASVVYAYLASLGVKIIAEDVTNRGRIDISVFFKDKIYIIEFKVGDDDALKQIKEKKYYEKYLNEKKEIYLIGINFDEEKRNINKFKWERVK